MIKEEYKSKYRDVLIHAIRAEDAMSDLISQASLTPRGHS